MIVFFLKYLFIFLFYCFLPFWLQIVLFIISCAIAPGANFILIIAMIIGFVLKFKDKHDNL